MTTKTKRLEAAKNAASAMSDLNVFYAIIAICESGTLSADSCSAESRLVKFCKAETKKCLRRYDRQLEIVSCD